MENYTVKYEAQKITISFKHISVIITDVTKEILEYVKDLVGKTTSFRYVYRAIATNPDLTVQTIR